MPRPSRPSSVTPLVPDRAPLLRVIALLVPLALLWWWPLPLHPASTGPAEPDAFLAGWHQVWLAWLLRETPLDQLIMLHSDLVAAPDGVDLRFYQEWLTSGLGALFSLPLELLLPRRADALVAGVNAANLLAWSFTGLSLVLLARTLGASTAGAALAVAAVLCSPVLRSTTVLACPEMLWAGAVAMSARAMLRGAGDEAGARSVPRVALDAAAWGALAGLATRYLLLAAAGWFVVALVGALALGRHRLARIAGLSLLFLVPVGLFLGWPQLTAGGDEAVLLEHLPSVPAPADFLLPRVVWEPGLDPAVEAHAYSAYVGWALLICAGLGAWRGSWQARVLAGGGAAMLVAAFGWQLPGGARLPLSWLASVLPVVENLHAPHRLAVVAQVLLAGAAALSVGPGRRAWLVVGVVVVEGVLAARGLYPMPVGHFPGPNPAMAAIQQAPGPVVDLAMDDAPRDGYHADLQRELRQVLHGAPLQNLPAWPGGGAPLPLADDPAVQLAIDQVLQQLGPRTQAATTQVPPHNDLARLAQHGARWLVVALPPDQSTLRVCRLQPDPPGARLDCAAASGWP